jgi:hypothetical protein
MLDFHEAFDWLHGGPGGMMTVERTEYGLKGHTKTMDAPMFNSNRCAQSNTYIFHHLPTENLFPISGPDNSKHNLAFGTPAASCVELYISTTKLKDGRPESQTMATELPASI